MVSQVEAVAAEVLTWDAALARSLALSVGVLTQGSPLTQASALAVEAFVPTVLTPAETPDPTIRAIPDLNLWLRAKAIPHRDDNQWLMDVPDQSLTFAQCDQKAPCRIKKNATPLGGPSINFLATGGGNSNYEYWQAKQVRASSVYSTAFAPWYVLDADAGTYWHSLNDYNHEFRVTLPTAQAATGYTITPVSASGPPNWSFQGSNDHVAWDTLDTRSSIAWSGTTAQHFTFSNPTAYKHYRFVITSPGLTYMRWSGLTLDGCMMPSVPTFDHEGHVFAVVRSRLANTGQNGTYAHFGSNASVPHYMYEGSLYTDMGITERRSFAMSAATEDITQWHIVESQIQGTELRTYIDGSLINTQTGVTRSWRYPLVVGQYSWDGEQAELMKFDRVLSSGERSQVLSYLDAEHFTAAPTLAWSAALGSLPVTVAVGDVEVVPSLG